MVGQTIGKYRVVSRLFRGTPDWVTVGTKRGFIPLRVNDDDLERVVAQLEARTGTKVVRAT
jgi:hypothetical protein